MIFVIPGLPPSEYSGNARVHWAEKRKARDNYYALICESIQKANGGILPKFKPLNSCNMTITFRLDNRRRDIDNLISRLKPGLDSLVKLNVITDDSINVIKQFTVRWENSKILETVIEICEC